MKMKTIGRIVAAFTAAVLCVGMTAGMMLSVSAEEINVYASTDYANKSELFHGRYEEKLDENGEVVKDEQGNPVKEWVPSGVMVEQADNSVIVFPAPEGYVEGVTERVKFIVDGTVIAEKYSDKTFVMPFCGVDLTFDGSFLAAIGGERIEIQIEKKEPILLQYTCPKCASTDKLDKDGNPTGSKYTPFVGDLSKYTAVDGSTTQYTCPRCKSTFDISEAGEPEHNEVVTGGITVIENEHHPVVGGYVYELNIYSDNKAIENYGDSKSGVKATVKVGAEAMNSAKSENSDVVFGVYAYLGQSGIYENMGAEIDEAAGTATFQLKDRGWFYMAGDKPGDVELTFMQLLMKWLPAIIIAVVVVAAGIVVLVVVLKKGKKAE